MLTWQLMEKLTPVKRSQCGGRLLVAPKTSPSLSLSKSSSVPKLFMETNRRKGRSSQKAMAKPDMVAVDKCQSELTASSSESSATGTTAVDCSENFSFRNKNAAPESSSMWTNEKHNLYLNSLEASFVNELHHSISLRGCQQDITCRPRQYQQLQRELCTHPPQIVGLHDGRHKKDKVEPMLESTADSDILQRSPWICYFTSSFKQHNAASQDSQQCIDSCTKVSHEEGTCAVAGGLTRTSELQPICHLSDLMIDDIIDVSDQNFVDEEKGEKLCSESLLKRLKTVEPDASSDD